MTTDSPIMVTKDDAGSMTVVSTPEHPAFQELIDAIQSQPMGPRLAYEHCLEGLFLVSRLLENCEEDDPETLEILTTSEVSPVDLQQAGLWFDQMANEIAKTIS